MFVPGIVVVLDVVGIDEELGAAEFLGPLRSEIFAKPSSRMSLFQRALLTVSGPRRAGSTVSSSSGTKRSAGASVSTCTVTSPRMPCGLPIRATCSCMQTPLMERTSGRKNSPAPGPLAGTGAGRYGMGARHDASAPAAVGVDDVSTTSTRLAVGQAPQPQCAMRVRSGPAGRSPVRGRPDERAPRGCPRGGCSSH